jgi:hypothetical protein
MAVAVAPKGLTFAASGWYVRLPMEGLEPDLPE